MSCTLTSSRESQLLEFHSGSSNAVKTANAVQESLDLALKDTPDDQARVVMVHSTMGHNFAQLLKAVFPADDRAGTRQTD